MLVFSNVQSLGIVEDGLDGIYAALLGAVGDEGTLIVPSFSYSFCRGEVYDHSATPSAVGVFSNHVLNKEGSVRSMHPNHSFAAVGAKATEVTHYVDKSSFGYGSVFTTMLRYDVKVLSLGVITNTYVHYVEHLASVPYRYHKDFIGTIVHRSASYEDTFPMFVRDLERPGTEEEDRGFAREQFFASGISTNLKFGYGIHRFFAADRYCDFMIDKVASDPYYLIDKAKYFSSEACP